METPKYRVRLFLSVDLTGSTAFKNKQKNPRDWLPHFEDFYSNFKDSFTAKFAGICSENQNQCKEFQSATPKLWKTIGDELIFVNRVDSCAQIITLVSAFRDAMDSYSTKIKDLGLDLKGNGWLASFPYPNQTVMVHFEQPEIITEAIEKQADETPHTFEFLGSGIDSGFRIAKNSATNLFTISPSLAKIICMTYQNVDTLGKLGTFEIKFLGTNKLKGVVADAEFPILGINTERNPKKDSLQKTLENLAGTSQTAPAAIKAYLEEFEKFHEVNSPALKLSGTDHEIEEPSYYREIFVPSWEKDFATNEESNKELEAGSQETTGTTISQDELEKVKARLNPKK